MNHSFNDNLGDLAAAGILVGTLAQLLPAIAALFTIIWTGLRIYESKTVQRLVHPKTVKKED